MRAAACLAMSCLLVHTAALAEPPGNRFVGTILFPNPRGGQFAYAAEWQDVPSRAAIREALPRGVTIAGNTDWMCHVDVRGRFHGCRMVTSWPRDPRYEKAGRRLIPKFVLSETAARDAQRNNAEVSFMIGFSGPGLSPGDTSSCPPPFCVPMLPPPPPPPSQG